MPEARPIPRMMAKVKEKERPIRDRVKRAIGDVVDG